MSSSRRSICSSWSDTGHPRRFPPRPQGVEGLSIKPDGDTLRQVLGELDADRAELVLVVGGVVRIPVLFAFDPRRTAILLLGGDKTGRWASWYRRAIPEADRLYDDYLEELRREG